MSTVTLEEAQAHLAELIDHLAPGEEVVIVRNAVPVVKLVGLPLEKPQPAPALDARAEAIEQQLAAIWLDVPVAEWSKLPADLTDHLDRYIYGGPD